MSAISTSFGTGGSNLTPEQNPSLATALREICDDLTELRAQLIATLAKLDLDVGVTDVNYESTLTPAALTTSKA